MKSQVCLVVGSETRDIILMVLATPAIAVAISRVEELRRGRHNNSDIHNLEVRVGVEVSG